MLVFDDAVTLFYWLSQLCPIFLQEPYVQALLRRRTRIETMHDLLQSANESKGSKDVTSDSSSKLPSSSLQHCSPAVREKFMVCVSSILVYCQSGLTFLSSIISGLAADHWQGAAPPRPCQVCLHLERVLLCIFKCSVDVLFRLDADKCNHDLHGLSASCGEHHSSFLEKDS